MIRLRRIPRPSPLLMAAWLGLTSVAEAGTPGLTHLFPAGGRRGSTVEVRVGGLDLATTTALELIGPGVQVPATVKRGTTRWIEGPLLPMPESQASEDYPKDYLGTFRIEADAPPGPRAIRAWTSEGACRSLPFVVGDLPEVIEDESSSATATGVPVTLPVTANGRIHPREDVDLWTFEARPGATYSVSVAAATLGVPLDARIEVLDPSGRRVAESDDDERSGNDPRLAFQAVVPGRHAVRILDTGHGGGPSYVYRLTITEGPSVQSVFPLGVRAGHPTPLELRGIGLIPGDRALATIAPGSGPSGPRTVETILTHERTGLRLGAIRLDVDDLPERSEETEAFQAPTIANGRIDSPGDVDAWPVRLDRSETIEVDLRAGRLGSPLLGTLRILDPSGKERARSDPNTTDPLLSFQAPESGTYRIEVADRFASRGGPEFAYRLRITPPPAPDYRLTFASDALTLPRGDKAKLSVQVERTSTFREPIAIEVVGLPKGVTLGAGDPKSPATRTLTVAPGQKSVELTLTAGKDARIDASLVRLIGNARVAGKSIERRATLRRDDAVDLDVDTIRLAIGLPCPFKITAEHDFRWVPRGSLLRRWYRIDRQGYDGPVEVRVADRQTRHLQGVTGPTIVVPPGVSRFDYWVELPPWMEVGRTSRAMILATGFIRDPDGRVHEVSDSPSAQQMQLVAVIEPGRLGLELGRSSIAAGPGTLAELPVRIRRGKLSGRVIVEVVSPAGVEGSVVLKQDAASAVLPIRFAPSFAPKDGLPPLVIRATLEQPGDPFIAEARVELVAG